MLLFPLYSKKAIATSINVAIAFYYCQLLIALQLSYNPFYRPTYSTVQVKGS
ncbi:hypothetical protein GGD38_007745 [Chitinophagaceae bacterium OAS944]|nr:hypothetical protein [Chitinophagaceae bacterium OAS944]